MNWTVMLQMTGVIVVAAILAAIMTWMIDRGVHFVLVVGTFFLAVIVIAGMIAP